MRIVVVLLVVVFSVVFAFGRDSQSYLLFRDGRGSCWLLGRGTSIGIRNESRTELRKKRSWSNTTCEQ